MKKDEERNEMSFYWKVRTMISGDYREMERNMLQYHNKKVIEKYKEKEKIYCIIRLYTVDGGLMCVFFRALEGISYSIQNGFIPIIDMQTKENVFLNKKERKNQNAWELFFEQPVKTEKTLDEIRKLPNKIIFDNPVGPGDILELMSAPEIVKYWRKLCKEYIRYSAEVKNCIAQYKEMFQSEDRVLGVLARGTDYLNPAANVAFGHPMQPDSKEVIANTKRLVKEQHCNKIFLATEDEKILQAMQAEFGDKLVCVEQKRYYGIQKKRLVHLADYAKDAVEMNRAYLTAIHYLSKCNCFFGGFVTGTTGAYLMSDGFEKFELWYKGKQGINDETTLDINKI